ncbi:hypothetical protein VN24_20550 [Paenibacillus beijingensis]|uniref:Uncharacterized protein n=1 Tax=Paenibacillus beijingensis TaxID=1126833 RepID=A0A0D5NNC3_9BACL|nr:hypothetical protein VN24_20550 [Paenibacillus beijingensis]
MDVWSGLKMLRFYGFGQVQPSNAVCSMEMRNSIKQTRLSHSIRSNELVLTKTQEDLLFRWQSGVGGPFLAKPANAQELSIEIACLEGKPAMVQEIPAFIA